VRNFFNRMFLINDAMRLLRTLINSYTESPLNMAKIYERMQVLSDDVRMMGEMLGYLAESLESCEIPPEPVDIAGRALYARLQIADLAGQLSMRVLDLKKTMEGVRQELAHLRHLANIVFETRQYKVHESVQNNTRQLIVLNETGQRSAATLRMLLLVLAGSLAFELLDRITGTWTVMDQDWFQDFANPMVRNFPVAWFIFSMFTWLAVAVAATRVLGYFVFVSSGVVTMRIRIMQRLLMERFNIYLATKNMVIEERQYDEKNTVVYFTWEETVAARDYGGSAPRVTVEYDRSTGHMLNIIIEYNRRLAKKNQSMTGAEVRNKIYEEMSANRIFEDSTFSFAESVKIASEEELRDMAANSAGPADAAARK
jgi:WD repeat-containing protein 35